MSLFSSEQCIIKRLLDAVFCDILINQGLGKCYQPRPYLDLDYSGCHKTVYYIACLTHTKLHYLRSKNE